MPADSKLELTEQQASEAGQRWRFSGGNALETLERVAVMITGVVAMKGGAASCDQLTNAADVIQGWISANPEASQLIGAAVAFVAREWVRRGHPSCVPAKPMGVAEGIRTFTAPLIVVGLCILSGCSALQLPPGAQAQASSVGIDVSPQGPIGPHVTFGSKAITITTAQPNDQPNLNRLAVEAPGISLKSTVATGSVGEQIKAAGGLETVLGPEQPATEQPVVTQPATED